MAKKIQHLNFLTMQGVVCLSFQSANGSSEPDPALLVPISFFANIQIS
jgi:hypothetical protein